MDLSKIVESKVLNRMTSIEYIISEKCQNNCKYCYRTYKHNRSPIFHLKSLQVKIITERLLALFGKTKEEFFGPRYIELYGGDPLIDYKNIIEILQVISTYGPKHFTFPTNARLISELTDYDIETFLNCVPQPIYLSFSVDGDPSESNRPLSKFGKMLAYNEKINYDRLYNIAKKYGGGFHPMLRFDINDKWLDTVKFFFETYNIIPYLLEIRHSLSKEMAINSVRELVGIRDYYESMKMDKDTLRRANTISASICPRGLGCSALTTLHILPNGDLPFCHRLIDPPWIWGNVHYNINLSKAVSYRSIYDHRNVPDCIACPVRITCSGHCLGACYEYWGDPWMPIPSVCDYIRLKHYVFSHKYSDWKDIINNVNINELQKSVYKKFGEEEVKKLIC